MADLAKKLNKERQRAWEEAKGLLDTATSENRSFTGEEEAKWSNLNKHVDTLEQRVKELVEGEQRSKDVDNAYNTMAEKRVENRAGGNTAEKRFNEEIRNIANRRSEGLTVPAEGRLFDRLIKGAGRPLNPIEMRTVFDNYLPGGTPGSFTNNTGAGIVPIDFYDQLVSYLVEVSGIMQTGPTVLATRGGEPIQMPIVSQHTGQLTGTNAYAQLSAGQGTSLAVQDPIFAQKVLTSNKFGILVQVPRELLDDAGVNLLGYLATSAGRSVGNVLGNALVNGGGGISGPLLTQAPVTVTGTASGSVPTGTGHVAGGPTYQDLISVEYSVIAPYRQSRSCYWMAADQSLGSLRKITDTVGRPLWEPSTVLGAPDLLLGKPIVADPFMPQMATGTTSIAFGDFSQYVVRMVGDVRFERSDDFAFGTDLVSFRAVVRADGNLLNPNATQFPRSQPVVLFQGAAS